MVYTTPPSLIFKDGVTTNVSVNTTANTLTLTGNAILTGLSEPTTDTSASTRNYTDVKTWKTNVRAATTGSITLGSPGTTSIDGLTIVDGDRVLVKNQNGTTPNTANGIYVYRSATTDYARTDDAQSGYGASGVGVLVTEGTTNGDTFWLCPTASASFNSTAIIFDQFVFNLGTVSELWYNDGGAFNTIPDFTYDTGTPSFDIAQSTNGSSLNVSTLAAQSGAISIATGTSATSVLSLGGSTLNLGTSNAATIINMATDTSHSGSVGLLNNASSSSNLSLGSAAATVNIKGVEGPTGIVITKTTAQSVPNTGVHDIVNYDTVTWTSGSTAPTIVLATGIVTINEDGLYNICYNIPVTSVGGASAERQIITRLLINGSATTTYLSSRTFVNSTSAGSATVTTNSNAYLDLSDTDTLELEVNQNYGAAIDICSSDKPGTWSIVRVNGS